MSESTKPVDKLDPTDTEYESYVVESFKDGTVHLLGGWGINVPLDHCGIHPALGERADLYGRGLGFPVRGIVIGGRVYRYRTAANAETDARAERQAREVKKQPETHADTKSRLDQCRICRDARSKELEDTRRQLAAVTRERNAAELRLSESRQYNANQRKELGRLNAELEETKRQLEQAEWFNTLRNVQLQNELEQWRAWFRADVEIEGDEPEDWPTIAADRWRKRWDTQAETRRLYQESKQHLDAIARVLHPHWPDGSRNAYTPAELATMVERLQDKARGLLPSTRINHSRELPPVSADLAKKFARAQEDSVDHIVDANKTVPEPRYSVAVVQRYILECYSGFGMLADDMEERLAEIAKEMGQ